jgi:hypothetical protein
MDIRESKTKGLHTIIERKFNFPANSGSSTGNCGGAVAAARTLV